MTTGLFVLLLIVGELVYLAVCLLVGVFSTAWNPDNSPTDADRFTCPECGRHVSRTAKSCPNCGRPISTEGQP